MRESENEGEFGGAPGRLQTSPKALEKSKRKKLKDKLKTSNEKPKEGKRKRERVGVGGAIRRTHQQQEGGGGLSHTLSLFAYSFTTEACDGKSCKLLDPVKPKP